MTETANAMDVAEAEFLFSLSEKAVISLQLAINDVAEDHDVSGDFAFTMVVGLIVQALSEIDPLIIKPLVTETAFDVICKVVSNYLTIEIVDEIGEV
jgi:hypothetical protein